MTNIVVAFLILLSNVECFVLIIYGFVAVMFDIMVQRCILNLMVQLCAFCSYLTVHVRVCIIFSFNLIVQSCVMFRCLIFLYNGLYL